jgi:hypothetical protein
MEHVLLAFLAFGAAVLSLLAWMVAAFTSDRVR